MLSDNEHVDVSLEEYCLCDVTFCLHVQGSSFIFHSQQPPTETHVSPCLRFRDQSVNVNKI
jgi:hypothetical protein